MARDRLLWDFKGLVTAPGRLARAEASCIQAKNLNFPAPGLVEKRKGFTKKAPIASGYPWKLFSSKHWGAAVTPKVLLSEGTAAGAIQLQLGDGIGAFANLATPDAQQVRGSIATRVQGAESLNSFYLAAQDAPVRLEPNVETSNVAKYAGMPRGLAANRGFGMAATGTLLPVGYARAYRITWHRYDSDGVLISGPPTGRWVVRNQVGTAGYGAAPGNTQFSVPLPREWGTNTIPLSTAYFYRVWANRTFNAGGGEEGDDEMYLIAEAFLTGADIAANVIGPLTDSTPDDFLQRQLALNTNGVNFPLGELGLVNGLVNADEPPPIAYDVVSWANVTWWADVRYRPAGQIKFLSVGAPTGLQDNDTITVQIGATPTVMRAKLVPALANDFQLYTALATTQMNLEATAQAFCAAFNAVTWATNVGLTAYPVGLPTSLAGVVYLEAARIDPTTAGLQVVSSRAAWYQYDGSAAGVGVGYGAEARNATCYAKTQRADAVPLVNRFTAGPNNARIIRQQPYRDRLFLFTDAGVYVITGRSFADFAIAEFALDLKLLAREAVCVCDDAVYAWCAQGIAKLTDGGWEIVSTPIEPAVKAAVEAAAVNAPNGQTSSLAFALGDTANHRVQFWFPGMEFNTGDVRGCFSAFVYDTRTQAWSTYEFEHVTPANIPEFRACGVFVDPRPGGGVGGLTGVVLGGEKTGSAAEGYLFQPGSSYFDSWAEPTGTQPVSSGLFLQFLVPDAGGATHWLQTVLQWDVWPTDLRISWNTERASFDLDCVPTASLTRAEPGRDCRRSNQLSVFLGSFAGEAFGLVGVQQRYVPGSPWARGRTR